MSKARGSGGAPQPAESAADACEAAESIADASQLGDFPSVRLNFGTFNCGMQQEMLTNTKHSNNLKRVIAKAVGERDLHIVTLCEVGGHKKGLRAAAMWAQDLVREVLNRHYTAISCQAYMATWQATTEPADDTGVTSTLLAGPTVVELSSPALEPQLVVMVFAIAAAEHPDKHGLLISGNLHIRTPTGQKTQTIATKKRITKQALRALEGRASMESLCSPET